VDAKRDGAGAERRSALEKPGRQVWVGTACSRCREEVVGAARPTNRNPRSAVPRIAAARASAGGRPGRRLDGAYREYVRRRRPAPHAAQRPSTDRKRVTPAGRFQAFVGLPTRGRLELNADTGGGRGPMVSRLRAMGRGHRRSRRRGGDPSAAHCDPDPPPGPTRPVRAPGSVEFGPGRRNSLIQIEKSDDPARPAPSKFGTSSVGKGAGGANPKEALRIFSLRDA
jgi:hypothetical protein